MSFPSLAKRFVPVLFASALVAAAAVSTAHPAVAGDPGDGDFTLERADRVEKEGRELLERGERADGARRIAEAWRIRAEIFAREARKARAEASADDAAARAKADAARIRAALEEREKALEAARAGGREKEEAEQAAACEALRAKLREAEAQAARGGGDEAAQKAAEEQKRKEVVEHLKQESATAERRAKDYAAAGDEKNAAEQMERSKRLWQKAEAIASGKEGMRGMGDGPGAMERERLAAEVGKLRELVESLSKAVDDLRRQIAERPK